MSSLNKVSLIGNIGTAPDIRMLSSGDKVANLSIATSEKWTDKQSGTKREKTQWHRVVIFNQNLVKICENHVSKGDKIYIEGALETRPWEEDGKIRYTTEIVLKSFGSVLTMLNSASGQASTSQKNEDATSYAA